MDIMIAVVAEAEINLSIEFKVKTYTFGKKAKKVTYHSNHIHEQHLERYDGCLMPHQTMGANSGGYGVVVVVAAAAGRAVWIDWAPWYQTN